jgi:hypothetical protein
MATGSHDDLLLSADGGATWSGEFSPALDLDTVAYLTPRTWVALSKDNAIVATVLISAFAQ